MTVASRMVKNTVNFFIKKFFKPPSPSPVYWVMVVEGIVFTILFSPLFFGYESIALMILGLQFLTLGSAEVLSTTQRMSGCLRIISIAFAVAVLILVASDPIWLR